MDSMGLAAPCNVDPGTTNRSVLGGLFRYPRWSNAILAAWTLNGEKSSETKKCNWNALVPCGNRP